MRLGLNVGRATAARADGFEGLEFSDVARPNAMGRYNDHPPFADPTCTVLQVPFAFVGTWVVVVANKSQVRRHGDSHAGLWLLDIDNPADIKPPSVFNVSELDSLWSAPPAWFGRHWFQEHLRDTLVYTAWFEGGLRIVDIADPSAPGEVGVCVPPPNPGIERPGTNDVGIDERGLIYTVDRYQGSEIPEFGR